MKRLLVTGSRGWKDTNRIHKELVLIHNAWGGPAIELVHGGAVGADRLAESEAQLLGWKTTPVEADWKLSGRRAGIERNEKMMLMQPAACLAFWDGNSRGTEDMIRRCVRNGIPVKITPQETK